MQEIDLVLMYFFENFNDRYSNMGYEWAYASFYMESEYRTIYAFDTSHVELMDYIYYIGEKLHFTVQNLLHYHKRAVLRQRSILWD